MRNCALTIWILIILNTTPCSEEGTQLTTILEGTWKSQCISRFPSFSGPPVQSPSYRLQQVFSGNNLNTEIINYSEDNCLVSESISNAESDNAVFTSSPHLTFTIGNQLTLSSNKLVTEIDFVTGTGNTEKNIFYIQGETLYFGAADLACITSATSSTELSKCYETRPDSINYTLGFAQNGEPTVMPGIL